MKQNQAGSSVRAYSHGKRPNDVARGQAPDCNAALASLDCVSLGEGRAGCAGRSETVADHHPLLLRGVEHHQIVASAAARTRAQEDWRIRAVRTQSQLGFTFDYYPGGVSSAALILLGRRALRTMPVMAQLSNLLWGIGLRVETLMCED